MVPSNSAFTDPSWLVPLLYRADWTQLCLSAEISTLVKLPRMVRLGPGEHGWLEDEADEDDNVAEDPRGDVDEDPRETWRLATEASEVAGEYPGGALPRWRDDLRRLLVAPGGRYRIEDISAGSPRCVAVEIADGRRCWRVWAEAMPGRPGLAQAELFDRVAVTVDAELGIALRLSYLVT